MTLLAAALTGLAIVTQDPSALRAAPRDSAAQQAVLWQGDTVEVRGERLDYLQVYDHRRERAGYLRASQLRITSLQPQDAPELLAVLRFVRDTPGSESLGIAYAAAYLKAAPAEAITAEPFDAIGAMAERLARRASARQASDATTAQLKVAAQYGVVFKSVERQTTAQLCYDGDAFGRVLAMASATAAQRARAALALTRDDCVAQDLRPTERHAFDAWRAEVLNKLSPTDVLALPELTRNRLRLRRSGVWAQLAFDAGRAGTPAVAQAAAQRALSDLAGVNKNELGDDDAVAMNDAAVRVGASRWAAEPPAPASTRLTVVTQAGQPGETCVLLTDPQHGPDAALARRCTYGVVWTASASVSPTGKALALAVQPLATWRELWVFRRGADGWQVDVLPPAATEPDLGVIEFAGWVPGADKLLLARDGKVDGRFKRSFEVASLATLNTEKFASTPSLLVLFGQWQDVRWKRSSLSLR